jgi:hypothetical protein
LHVLLPYECGIQFNLMSLKIFATQPTFTGTPERSIFPGVEALGCDLSPVAPSSRAITDQLCYRPASAHLIFDVEQKEVLSYFRKDDPCS